MSTCDMSELLILRMEVQAMRDSLVASTDAMLAKIDRLLPASAAHTRYQRFERYSAEDWQRELEKKR